MVGLLAGISRQEGRPGITFITAHAKSISFGRALPQTSGYNSFLVCELRAHSKIIGRMSALEFTS